MELSWISTLRLLLLVRPLYCYPNSSWSSSSTLYNTYNTTYNPSFPSLIFAAMACRGKHDSFELSIHGNDGVGTRKWGHGFEFVEYNGFFFTQRALEHIKDVLELFQARPDDVFLCSAMKTGTTWMKAILASITNSTDILKEKGPHDLMPSLGEYRNSGSTSMLLRKISEMPSPRVLHAHMPYSVLPHSINSLGCRIIYIARNPNDTFVSYWKFMDKLRPAINVEGAFSKEDVFDDFCSGVSFFGPYVDHVLEYWNASKENPNILFLTYEDLMADTFSFIRRIADFIGRTSLSEGEIARISTECSFKSLTSFHVNQTGKMENSDLQNKSFFRRGEVGDWKNHFTTEMSNRLEFVVERKLEGSGFRFKYELSDSGS